jgi:GET complex subunit GET2
MPHNSFTLVSFIGLSTLTCYSRNWLDQPPPYSPPRGNPANFIGEDPLPTSPVPDQPTRPPPDLLAGPPPGSPAWSNEQQHQFLQSLLDSAPNEPFPTGVNMPPGTPGAGPEDPLLAFMSSLGVGEGVFQGERGVPQSQMEEKPKTYVQKILPLLHPMAMWALVAFFIFWREPESFRARHSAVNSSGDVWNRWAQLAGGPAHSWSIEPEVSLPLVAAAQLTDVCYSHFSGPSFLWNLHSTRCAYFLAL